MKLFDDNDMQQGATAGNFGFSGVRPEKLGATEYTLVTMVTDISGSVSPFAHELLAMKKAIVGACQKSPRAEFLMLRDVEFNGRIQEVHGFKELANVDSGCYVAPDCSGTTALYDATYAAVAATNEYARSLTDADFSVNGIVFVETDGEDVNSVQTPAAIAAEIQRGITNEWLESMLVILVGVNAARYRASLQEFAKLAGIAQFVEVPDATPQHLAKIANFVSRSISSQSQSLGTGGPSQPLTFD